jgi:hypothetical protein
MDDSILNSIKEMLGLSEDYVVFDAEVMAHINAALMHLIEIGVGPEQGYFLVSDATATWRDFIKPDAPETYSMTKTFVYLYVRTIFDPPSSSYVLDAFKKTMAELEWRLNVQAETPVN